MSPEVYGGALLWRILTPVLLRTDHITNTGGGAWVAGFQTDTSRLTVRVSFGNAAGTGSF